MSVSAMYPGTFDPITLGHHDLVRRAATIFDRVVVAVATDTGGKQTMFSVDERVGMATDVLSDQARVAVVSYVGLTVKFAEENGLNVVVRGLRAVSDFEFEFQLASMSRHLAENVETVFLTPTQEYTFVSSTRVREIAMLGGEVTKFVDPIVEQALARKYEEQRLR